MNEALALLRFPVVLHPVRYLALFYAVGGLVMKAFLMWIVLGVWIVMLGFGARTIIDDPDPVANAYQDDGIVVEACWTPNPGCPQ